MKTWKIVACLIPVTLGASIALTVQASHIGTRDGVRTVTWIRTKPCSTCGHATPITLHCENGDWHITEPGSIGQLWAKYCPGQTYTWKVES